MPRTAGISLDDSTALQKYLDLVDWYSLDIFPSEFEPQENMKWHTNFNARGLKQKQPVTTKEHSDDEPKTPEADTQRSLRDWYIQVQADGRMLRKQSAIRQNASVASSSGVRAQGHQAGLHGCVRGTWSEH